jgi:hypothetical protein
MLVSPDRVPHLFRHLTAARYPDRIGSHELSQLRLRPHGRHHGDRWRHLDRDAGAGKSEVGPALLARLRLHLNPSIAQGGSVRPWSRQKSSQKNGCEPTKTTSGLVRQFGKELEAAGRLPDHASDEKTHLRNARRA